MKFSWQKYNLLVFELWSLHRVWRQPVWRALICEGPASNFLGMSFQILSDLS